MTNLSRREFALLAAGTAIAALKPSQAAHQISAQEVIDLIQQNIGSPWKSGMDGFKAGDQSTPVRGIGVTALATVDVLEKANAAGLNLVITHEPLYFGRADAPVQQTQAQLTAAAASNAANRPPGVPRGVQPLAADDPLYLAKKERVVRYGTVVWRFHDNLIARKENDLAAGLGEALGWTRYRVKGDPSLYEIPAATLDSIVAELKKRLNVRGGVRVVGDRVGTMRRVILLPGMHSLPDVIDRISDAELTIIGEAREWEVVEYIQDMITAGERRGLIMLGRVLSVQPGMRSVASWLAPLTKPVRAQFIANGDLYWRPA